MKIEPHFHKNIFYQPLAEELSKVAKELAKSKPNEDIIAESIYKVEYLNELSIRFWQQNIIELSEVMPIIMNAYYEWRKIF